MQQPVLDIVVFCGTMNLLNHICLAVLQRDTPVDLQLLHFYKVASQGVITALNSHSLGHFELWDQIIKIHLLFFPVTTVKALVCFRPEGPKLLFTTDHFEFTVEWPTGCVSLASLIVLPTPSVDKVRQEVHMPVHKSWKS